MAKKKTWCVYCHVNYSNNKRYVGLTCQIPEIRWKNGYGYKDCPKFFNAIQKYGWDNFEHIILEKDLTLEEANDKEQQYIILYDSVNNGYNIAPGGGSTYGIGHNISQYRLDGSFVKEWGSISDIENELNIDDASNIYNCINGKNNSCYGFQWSYERKDNIPPIKSKSEIISEVKRKPVYCYTRDGVFVKKYEYLEQVQQDGFNYKNISECCKGNRLTSSNYQWRYEYFEEIPPVAMPHELTAKKQYKKVYQYSLDGAFIQEFDSLTQAAEYTGVGFKGISKCCLHKTKSYKGFYWSYEYVNDINNK